MGRRLMEGRNYREAAETVFRCRLMPEGAAVLMEWLRCCKAGELDAYRVPDPVAGHRCSYFLPDRKCKLMSVGPEFSL